MEDITELIVKEEAVLEKFEGDPADGLLLERITLLNGEITKHEFFEDGELVHSVEGGTGATN